MSTATTPTQSQRIPHDPHSRVVNSEARSALLARSMARAAHVAAAPDVDARATCRAMLRDYQRACGADKERKAEIYDAAKAAVKLVFTKLRSGRDVVRRVQLAYAEARDLLASASLVRLAPILQSIHARVGNRSATDRRKLALLVQEHLRDWQACYIGRLEYRRTCEVSGADPGHDAAYHIFKLALLIGHVLSIPPPPTPPRRILG